MYKESEIKSYKLSWELEPGDNYGKAKVVRVIKPFTPKDLFITLVLDNEEVVRIDKNSTLQIIQKKTAE